MNVVAGVAQGGWIPSAALSPLPYNKFYSPIGSYFLKAIMDGFIENTHIIDTYFAAIASDCFK